MAGLGKELDSLDSTIVSSPGVKPLLRDKAVVLLIAQIAWCLYKTFASLVEHTAISVVYRAWLKERILTGVFHLGLSEPFLSLFLVGLHDSLLLLGENASFLTLELLHALVVCPRSLEVSLARVAELLSLCLQLSSFCFLGLTSRSIRVRAQLANIETRSDSCTVGGVHRQTRVVKPHSFIIEAGHIKLSLLNEASHVVLLTVQQGFPREASYFILIFGYDKILYVYFRSRVDHIVSIPI